MYAIDVFTLLADILTKIHQDNVSKMLNKNCFKSHKKVL